MRLQRLIIGSLLACLSMTACQAKQETFDFAFKIDGKQYPGTATLPEAFDPVWESFDEMSGAPAAQLQYEADQPRKMPVRIRVRVVTGQPRPNNKQVPVIDGFLPLDGTVTRRRDGDVRIEEHRFERNVEADGEPGNPLLLYWMKPLGIGQEWLACMVLVYYPTDEQIQMAEDLCASFKLRL